MYNIYITVLSSDLNIGPLCLMSHEKISISTEYILLKNL